MNERDIDRRLSQLAVMLTWADKAILNDLRGAGVYAKAKRSQWVNERTRLRDQKAALEWDEVLT